MSFNATAALGLFPRTCLENYLGITCFFQDQWCLIIGCVMTHFSFLPTWLIFCCSKAPRSEGSKLYLITRGRRPSGLISIGLSFKWHRPEPENDISLTVFSYEDMDIYPFNLKILSWENYLHLHIDKCCLNYLSSYSVCRGNAKNNYYWNFNLFSMGS